MSELRTVEIQVEMPVAKQVARKLKAELRTNDTPNAYATRGILCDLVIKYKGAEFGIKDGSLVHDDMHSHIVAEFTKEYLVEQLRRRGLNPVVRETAQNYEIFVAY